MRRSWQSSTAIGYPDRIRHRPVQEILLQYVEAVEAGNPERPTLIAAHPEFAKEIAEFLAEYHHLNRVTAPLVPGKTIRAARSETMKVQS
jgi:hypothetical protein